MHARNVAGGRLLARMFGGISLGIVLAVSLLATCLPAAAAVYNFGYDSLGRLTEVVDASGNTATYSYDAAGNITAIARGNAAVAILGFSPQSGPVGTTVTISGSGFSATASQDTVNFNGTAATISSASATQLVVQVPTGATTGPISVMSPSGSATSSTPFTVSQGVAPTISSFTPTIGVAGTSVSISGTNFQTTLNDNSLTFNTREAPVSAATTTSLTAAVPISSTSGRLAVTTAYGRATSSQDFFVPPPPHVVSDVAITGRMTIGGSQTVSLTSAGKIGLILFDGTAGQKVSLKVTSSSFGSCGSGTIQFIKPDGSYSPSANLCNNTFLDTLQLPITGTYTILVAPNSSDTGSVTFTLYNVPTDATGAITMGGPAVTLTTTVPGQNGSLTFSGTAGQVISLNTSQNTIGCYYLGIMNPDGTNLYGPGSNCGTPFVDPVTLPATGTYTITLGHWGAGTGSLTFQLYNVPPDATGTITMGGPAVTLTTTVPGQNGSLTFSGTAGQVISLNTSQNTIGCYKLGIKNPDGTNLYGPGNNCGTPFVDPVTLPATGTYTITLGHLGAGKGSLTFQLYNVPPDATGTITMGGPAVTLTTTVPGQNGSLTFSGTAGQQVSVTTSQDTFNSCFSLAVVKPDGTNLYGPAGACSNGFLDPMTLPATGTYTIRLLHNGSGIGSLTFQLYNVPSDVTGTITMGGPAVTLTTTVPGQNGSLTFSGTAGQVISLNTSQNTIGCYKLGIKNPDGTNLYGPSGQCGTPFVDPVTLPATGTYTITLGHSGAGTGSLTFQLYSVPPDATGTITIGGPAVTLTTTVPGQNGSLTFSGTSGQRVSVTTSQDTFNSCFSLAVVKPDGTNLYGPAGACSAGGFGPLTLPASGTYTIRLIHNGSATGSLTFTLTSS